MSDIRLNSRWTGLRRLKRVLAATGAGVAFALGKGRIEQFLLKRTQDRFLPRGSAPTAQRDPSGKDWPQIKASTVRRRKRNRNRAQALFDIGTMAKAVKIISSNVSFATLRSALGGEFIIGVDKGSEAYHYFALHNRGGRNIHGALIPRRQFMGVGKDDVTAIGAQVKSDILGSIRGA